MGEPRRIADRYELVTEIGAGGMGVVWRARDVRLGRDVALKLLAPGAIGNEVARARLLREAHAAAKLQHEGIVRVHDAGETPDGGAFLVMELVGGRSLRELIEEGTASFSERAGILVAVADAIAYAHEAGIIHRDIKPDNILVRPNGVPVVLDFGLAKPIPAALADTVEAAEADTLTKEGHIVGTPSYLAPEQLRGPAVGPAADQFALGVTAFEVFTGRLPWKGEAPFEVLASMLADRPLRASDVDGEIPTAAADVLDRAMEKDPDERFPSVAAFATALAEACGVSRRASASGTARRRPRGATLAGAAILTVAVGLGIRASTRGGAGSTDAAAGAVAALGADDVVACPVFDVTIEELAPPHGWLGAAAAGLACDRAQVMLGGRSGRTLLPAELLKGIPREPVDDAPLDPFSRDGAAAEMREAARARATATIDGSVTMERGDFVVRIVARTRDGRELGRGEGRGFELFVAVSQAMRAAARAFAPTAPSAFQREWMRVDSIDAALDLLDVTTAVITEDDVETAVACRRFGARSDVRADMAYHVRAFCAERLERTELQEAPPPIDDSSLAALVTTVAAHRARGGPAATGERVDRLVAILDRVKDPDERAIVIGAIAELAYYAGDLRRAQSYARMAVQASPKLVDVRGTPWHRLAFASQLDATISVPHASWLAWEPVAVQNAGSHGVPYTRRVERFGRGYLLGRRGYFATAYADGLAHLGKVENARSIAEQIDSDFLRVRVLIAQVLFRKAITFGRDALRRLPADDANAGTAYRILAAITEASRYLGKETELAEEVFDRYLFAEPPRMRIGVVPFMALAYACADAPPKTAKRCARRVREVYDRGDAGAIVGNAPSVIEGLEHWVSGDAKAAATVWRPMLRESGVFMDESFRHVLVDAFDAAGAYDLAEQADEDFIAVADEPGAMDLAFVRSAFRAEKRGQPALARKLAEKSLAALRYADDDVPVARDLEALLKRLSSK